MRREITIRQVFIGGVNKDWPVPIRVRVAHTRLHSLTGWDKLVPSTLKYIAGAPQEQPDLSGLPEGIDPEDL